MGHGGPKGSGDPMGPGCPEGFRDHSVVTRALGPPDRAPHERRARDAAGSWSVFQSTSVVSCATLMLSMG